MPHYEVIKYIWKFPRPRHDAEAEDLINAAYTTAKRFDPTTSQILIRSNIHKTTLQDGRYVKDDPHITIAVKNPRQVRDRNHRALHGYTRSENNYRIIDVTPNNVVNPVDTPDHKRRGSSGQAACQRPKRTINWTDGANCAAAIVVSM